MIVILFVFLAFLGLLAAVPFWLEANRKRALVRADGHHEASRAIVDRRLFAGMKEAELRQAWGPPEEIETRTVRGGRKETWLYGGIGGRRFRNRVYLENGVLVAWKQRRGGRNSH